MIGFCSAADLTHFTPLFLFCQCFNIFCSNLLLQTQPTFTGSKSNKANTRAKCEICSKLNINNIRTTKMPFWWCLFVNLSADFTHCSGASIVDFEQGNVGRKLKGIEIKWIIDMGRLLVYYTGVYTQRNSKSTKRGEVVLKNLSRMVKNIHLPEIRHSGNVIATFL